MEYAQQQYHSYNHTGNGQPQHHHYTQQMPPQMSCDIKPRLTKDQHDILENHFQKHNKPSTATKKGFAETLGVSLDKVNVSVLVLCTDTDELQAETCTELVSESPRKIEARCEEAGWRVQFVPGVAKPVQRLQLRLRHVPVVHIARIPHDDAAMPIRRSNIEHTGL